jgi:subtilisin family serine protease
MPRSRDARAATAALLFALIVVAAMLASRGGAHADGPAPASTAAGWQGLLGDRPKPLLGQRQIVLLRPPSLSQRVRRAGGSATEAQMRAWVAAAAATQRQVLSRLAFRGAPVEPEHVYLRVLNGFAASLDARTVALLERDPSVSGVYPVRAAYPASLQASVPSSVQFGPSSGRRPGVVLPGFDGRGVTVAVLDTGIDLTHPYLRSRLREGIDIVDPSGDASAQFNPSVPGRPERHGTELAGLVAGVRGPDGLAGVAPGAAILPIRVAGWQPDAAGGVAVYARTDQLIAGLEAAVDPDGDGDAHDAVRVALVGVAEPFAAFASSPLARACAGALALDTLVVAPAGNDGPAGPTYGNVGGPGGAPAALTVAALDARYDSPSVHVLLRSGLGVLLAGEQPLGGAVPVGESVTLPVVAGKAGPAPRVGGRAGVATHFDRQGYSIVAGSAALLATGVSSPEAIREAVAAGARAILVDGPLPAGALGLDEPVDVPILGLAHGIARATRSRIAAGEAVTVSIGAPEMSSNVDRGSVAPFSSRGLAFDGGAKPELAAAGVGLATADAGRFQGGAARYGAISGTSAAAAVVAGSVALLAQARPDLDAAALKSALVASAAPFAGDSGAGGAGLIDVQRAAAVELLADPPLPALGSALARDAEVGRRITIRNVSRRRLDVVLRPARRSPATHVVVTPSRIRIWPGQSVRVSVSARVPVLPRTPAALRGTLTARPRTGVPLRIRWVLSVPVTGRPLLRDLRLSRTRFRPSDKKPAVLSLVAGRLDGRGERPQLLPLERLDVELWSRGRRRGSLSRLRDLLPGRYAFGITGRGPAGHRLAPGAYELRLLAWPVGGGDLVVSRVRFRIG